MQLAKGMPYPAVAPAVSRPGLTQRWFPLGTLLAFPAEGNHRSGADGDPVPRDFSVDGFPPRGELLDQEVCHRCRQESKEDPSHCRHRNPFCTYSSRTVIRWVLASQRQDQTDSTKHASHHRESDTILALPKCRDRGKKQEQYHREEQDPAHHFFPSKKPATAAARTAAQPHAMDVPGMNV